MEKSINTFNWIVSNLQSKFKKLKALNFNLSSEVELFKNKVIKLEQLLPNNFVNNTVNETYDRLIK